MAQSTREPLRTTLQHFGLAEDTLQLVLMLGMVPSRRLPSFVLLRPHHLSNHFRWIRAGEDFATCSSEEHIQSYLTDFSKLIFTSFDSYTVPKRDLVCLLRQGILEIQSDGFCQYLRLSLPSHSGLEVMPLLGDKARASLGTEITRLVADALPGPFTFSLQDRVAHAVEEVLVNVVMPTLERSSGKLSIDRLYRLSFFSLLNGISPNFCLFESSSDSTTSIGLLREVSATDTLDRGANWATWIKDLDSVNNLSASSFPPRNPHQRLLTVLAQNALPVPGRNQRATWVAWMKDLDPLKNVSASSFASDCMALDLALFSNDHQSLSSEFSADVWAEQVQAYGAQLCHIGIAVDKVIRKRSFIGGRLSQSSPAEFCPISTCPFLVAQDVERKTSIGEPKDAIAHGNIDWFCERKAQFHPIGLVSLILALGDAHVMIGEYEKAEQYFDDCSGLYSLTSHLRVATSLRISLARRRLDKVSLDDIGSNSPIKSALQNIGDMTEAVKFAVLEELTAVLSHLCRLGFSVESQRSSLLQHALRIFSMDALVSSDWRLRELSKFKDTKPDAEADSDHQCLLSRIPELLLPSDPDFQDQLQDWVIGLLLQGIQYQSNGALREVWFVDSSALESFYRDTPDVAEKLIAAVAPGRSSSINSDRISVGKRQGISFMLLILNRGALIREFLPHASLSDSRLPFKTRPEYFPRNDDELWRSFQQLQWAFCVPRTWLRNESYLFEVSPQEIIPISERMYVGEGCCAVLEKVRFHPGFEPQQSAIREEGQIDGESSASGKVYALKTFNTISSEVFFTAEMRAFTHLQATNHRPAGLIEFYGGISCPPTYSIILEYMDRGDLEQYWKSTSAPVTEKDVQGFWAAFTALAEASAFLHEIPVQDGERVWGWHQDIKPSNILVASGTSGESYDIHFKLADFGLSHFEREKAGKEEIIDWDSHGNMVYGSPETARRGEASTDKIPSEVPGITQAVDIWSLGCVCSEALLWVVFGHPGIEFFKRARYEERSQATDEMPHIPRTSFHDGRKTLDIITTTLVMVEDQLNVYLESSRALLTSISGMVANMLSFEPEQRPKASDIVRNLQSALQHKATVPEQATNPEPAITRKTLPPDFSEEDDLNMVRRGIAKVTQLLAKDREGEATEAHNWYLAYCPAYRLTYSTLVQYLAVLFGSGNYLVEAVDDLYKMSLPRALSTDEYENIMDLRTC